MLVCRQQCLIEMAAPTTKAEVRRWDMFCRIQPMRNDYVYSYRDHIIYSEGGYWRVFFGTKPVRVDVFTDIMDALIAIDKEVSTLMCQRAIEKVMQNETV